MPNSLALPAAELVREAILLLRDAGRRSQQQLVDVASATASEGTMRWCRIASLIELPHGHRRGFREAYGILEHDLHALPERLHGGAAQVS